MRIPPPFFRMPLFWVLLAFGLAGGCQVKSDGINASQSNDGSSVDAGQGQRDVGGGLDQSFAVPGADAAAAAMDSQRSADSPLVDGQVTVDVNQDGNADRQTPPAVDAGQDAAAPADAPVVPPTVDAQRMEVRPAIDGAGEGGADAPMDAPASSDGAATDSGAVRVCITADACPQGQVCTTSEGVCNAAPGCRPGLACPAVCYGTCQPRGTRTDAGGADVVAGEACGNTTCAKGTTCCNASCGVCVGPGGACTAQLCLWPSCDKDSDCKNVSDYCTGCDCRALHKTEELPTCNGPGVQCFADPCQNRVALCVNRRCVGVPAP